MKLLTYWQNDALRLGVVTDAGVVDVAAAANGSQVPTTIDAVLQGGSDALSALSSVASGAGAAHVLQEDSLTLGPCVPNPGQDHLRRPQLPAPRRRDQRRRSRPRPCSSRSSTTPSPADNEEVPLPTNVATQYD